MATALLPCVWRKGQSTVSHPPLKREDVQELRQRLVNLVLQADYRYIRIMDGCIVSISLFTYRTPIKRRFHYCCFVSQSFLCSRTTTIIAAWICGARPVSFMTQVTWLRTSQSKHSGIYVSRELAEWPPPSNTRANCGSVEW